VLPVRIKQLRVLHIIDSLIQAGAEALVKDMLPRMRARGVHVSVAVLKELNSPFERELREKKIPFLPTGPGGIYSPGHIFTLANNLRGFDLVHLYLFPAQLFGLLAVSLAGTKIPILLSEGTPLHRRRKRWLHGFDQWMYERYNSIACASEGIASSLREWIPGISQKLTVIPNGIDVEHFQNAMPASRQALGIRDDRCVLLYVASFQERKDHGTILRAVAQVRDTDLVLVGDGELRKGFESDARSLGIAERVHFLGRRNDIPQLLKMADIYVHAPAFEGFGIATAEAMAAGKPIVASDVPGLAQVVGDAGILVPPGNPTALAAGIKELIASESLRLRLSRIATERATRFGIERTVDAYVGLYEMMLAT